MIEPSDAERVAARHPMAAIWREVLPDGTHGEWVAELRVQLRALTPVVLSALLDEFVQAIEAHQHPQVACADDAGDDAGDGPALAAISGA